MKLKKINRCLKNTEMGAYEISALIFKNCVYIKGEFTAENF